MSVRTQIDRISSEVIDQSDLIAQIASSFYNITGISDCASVTTGKLADNTVALESILSAIRKMSKQTAKTITPSTSNQIAVQAGYYTTGDVIVVGDANLVASNIKKGVNIFGVTGTYEPLVATHDGAGNVTIIMNNAVATTDDAGNVSVTSI